MQPIHLTYTPERADFAALFANERTPTLLRMIFFAGVVGMSMGLGWLTDNVAVFAALTDWSPPWGEVLTVAAMVVAMFGVLMVVRRLACEVRAVRAAGTATPLTVDADDDGVSVTQAGRLEVYPWPDVLAAWLGRAHVFFTFSGGGRIAVPGRAFAGSAAMVAFAEAAEARVRRESAREDSAAPDATPEAAR